MTKTKKRRPTKNIKSKKYTKPRKQPQKQHTEKSKKNSVLEFSMRIGSSILFWVLTVITIISFVFLVYPRLSVYPGDSLNPINPLDTPFILKNDGYWPLVNVAYGLSIGKATIEIGQLKINMTDSTFRRRDDIIPELGANRSSVIPFIKLSNVPGKLTSPSEIHISLKYRIFLVPYSFQQFFSFKTDRKTNGEYIWLPY